MEIKEKQVDKGNNIYIYIVREQEREREREGEVEAERQTKHWLVIQFQRLYRL